MLTFGEVLFHDNARPHTAALTRVLPENFNWALFDYPSYSPDLTPGDYHLFYYLKNRLGSQRFSNNEDLSDGVKTWLISQVAGFVDTVIQKLIPRYEKCLSSRVNYGEN
jgi:transposase